MLRRAVMFMAALAGCDQSATAPPVNVKIEVIPALVGSFSGLGGTHTLAAAVSDTLGNPLDTVTVTWSLAKPSSSLSITDDGVLTVLGSAAPGDYTVRASGAAVVGTAIVRVLPRPTGRLVFSANPGSGAQLFVKNLGGDGDAVQITTGTGVIAGIGVDESSRSLFFGRGTLPNSDIFRVDFDGLGLVNLTNNPVAQNQGPTVNPVTHEVYFTRRVGTANQVFRMQPDGSGLTQVTTSPQSKVTPSVSPDGQMLAWVEIFQPGFNQEIMVAPIDGTNPVRFTDRAGIDGSPTFEASASLYWSGVSTVSDRDVFMADLPAGANPRNVTQQTGSDDGVSRGCSPNSFTFLRSASAHHYDVAGGFAVKYTLPSSPGMTFARRICQ